MPCTTFPASCIKWRVGAAVGGGEGLVTVYIGNVRQTTDIHSPDSLLNRPKHQSGENFVWPTTRKDNVIWVCLPVKHCHIR